MKSNPAPARAPKPRFKIGDMVERRAGGLIIKGDGTGTQRGRIQSRYFYDRSAEEKEYWWYDVCGDRYKEPDLQAADEWSSEAPL